jgi:tetratricopeptide (TPR) repeat protein
MSMNGRLDQALQSLHRARELTEPLLAANPQSIPIRRQASLISRNEALVLARQRHPNEAMTSINSALSIIARVGADDPNSIDTQLATASIDSCAGSILSSQAAELFEAVSAYEKAVETRQKVLKEHPEFDEQAYRLALDQIELGKLLQKGGQHDRALQTFHLALKLFERLDQRYPGLRQYLLGRGIVSNALAELLRERNEAAESLALAQNARDLLLRLLARHSRDSTIRTQLARSHNLVGRLLERSGLRTEALHSFQRAIDLYETMMPNLEPSYIYDLACNISLCIPLIGPHPEPGSSKPASTPQTKSDQRRRDFYGDRAIQTLRLAGRGGVLSTEILETNTDLDPLRQRPDFARVLKDVENQSITNQK